MTRIIVELVGISPVTPESLELQAVSIAYIAGELASQDVKLNFKRDITRKGVLVARWWIEEVAQ